MEKQNIIRDSKHEESRLKQNFIHQQGFDVPQVKSCGVQFSALLFFNRGLRFSQGMGAMFSLTIACLLLFQQGMFMLAVGALVFGGFCLGSFVFHLIRGRLAFAKQTLPWGSGAE